jgi:pilus assembly protein Flp/PilA
MRPVSLEFCTKLKNLITREEGQDLVEYALVIALISIAAVAAMKTLSTAIVGAFSRIATSL